MFSSNAIAETKTLNTEPGSYVFETAGFLHMFCRAELFAVDERESQVADKLSLGVKGEFKS